jgi:hypothetical protein
MLNQYKRLQLLALLALAVASHGCDAAGPDSVESGSICPLCGPQSGGETTSFWDSPCEALIERAEIEIADADTLGYDTAVLLARIRREFDQSFSWEAMPTPAGGPASSYDEQTRCRAEVTAGALVHARPDPSVCDGSSCQVPARSGQGTEPMACPDRLHIAFDMEFQTMEGAVSGTAHGEVVQWNQGFEGMIGDAAEHLTGYADTDLRNVEGSLRLHPLDDVEHSGILAIEMEFGTDSTHGVVQPKIAYRVTDDHSEDEGRNYEPLRGTW